MRTCASIIIVLFAVLGHAQNRYLVSSSEEFIEAHEKAQFGDSIIWAKGIYKDVRMDVNKDGLIITSEPLGSALFSGVSRAVINSNYITFSGIQYVGGNIGTLDIMKIYGSDIQISHVNMKNYTCRKYLIVDESSRRTVISHCNFEKRLNLADQNILSILVDNEPGYHKIQYCSFKNFDGIGQDQGVEPIRIGVSSQSDLDSRTLVEYCYFTQCNGDGEIISHKARQNVYRYNTFENNPVAELVLRHGDDGIVYGNYFLNNMGGIRIREGSNHFVYNNYFQDLNRRTIYLQNESSDPLSNIHIYHNTVVNSEEIRLGSSGNNRPTNVFIANNTFSNPTNQIFDEDTGDEQWIANYAFGLLGIDAPMTGIVNEDPLLEENGFGFFQPNDNSPLIESAKDGYPLIPLYDGMDYDNEISLDIMKQPRSETIQERSIGSTEFNSTVVVKPHVTEHNTGPVYLFDSVLDYITSNLTKLNISNIGESKSVFISSNVGWTVSSNVSWISTDISSGSNDQPILLTIDQNSNSSERTGIVTISDGSISAEINLAQDAGAPSGLTEEVMNEIFIYPNPTNNNIKIKNLPSEFKNFLVEISHTDGRVISSYKISSFEKEINVNLNDLKPNSYILSLSFLNQRDSIVNKLNRKIVKY